MVMATEKQTNQALVLALLASNSQPSVPDNNALVSELSAHSVQPSSTALAVRPSALNVVTPANVSVS